MLPANRSGLGYRAKRPEIRLTTDKPDVYGVAVGARATCAGWLH